MPFTEWTVLFTPTFETWFLEQDEPLQDSLYAVLKYLKLEGYQLSRPYADTIKGSKYPNMKELRVQHQSKPIRAFFAFDPLRQAVILCAGDKSNDKRFYEKMIRLADDEFTAYLHTLEK